MGRPSAAPSSSLNHAGRLHPAFQAGLAVSGRGVGAIRAMAVVGRLTQLVDNRALIAGGLLTR